MITNGNFNFYFPLFSKQKLKSFLLRYCIMNLIAQVLASLYISSVDFAYVVMLSSSKSSSILPSYVVC